MTRDKLAAFLYWAAYRLERTADRVWYGKHPPEPFSIDTLITLQRQRNKIASQIMEHKR